MKKPSKKVIFFPVEFGIAHVLRSLAVAEKLADQGHNIIFAVAQHKAHFVTHKKIKLVPITPMLEDGNIASATLVKLFKHMEILVDEELSILQAHKPDLVVIDNRFSTHASATISKITTVHISGTLGLPTNSYVPNPTNIPALNAITKPILNTIGMKVKNDVSKVLMDIVLHHNLDISLGNLYSNATFIIPETKSYAPVHDPSLKLNYVGPIMWEGFNNTEPDWLSKIKPNGKTIYVSFGGTGLDAHKLIELSELLADQGYRVIVSCAKIADPKDFPKRENLFVSRYLPGEKVCKKVDLVLCHGGQGTLYQAMFAKTPTVSLPFNADQIFHALRFQELGMGEAVFKLKFGHIKHLIKFDWQAILNMTSHTPNQEVVDKIEEVLKDKTKYQKNISKFLKTLPNVDGATQSAKIISNLVNY